MNWTVVKDLELTYAQNDHRVNPQKLVILLHGMGGNEWSLTALAEQFPPDVGVILARHPLELGPGAYGSFRVVFTTAGPLIDAEAAEASRLKLIRFTQQLQERTSIPPEKTLAAGFSQGGIMAASLALTRPDLLRGFAILSGRILPEIQDFVAPPDAFQDLEALVLHGNEDTTIPVSWAEKSANWLKDLGIPYQMQLYPARHEITTAMSRDFISWVSARFTN